jgi:hypothetical protein
MPVPPMLNADPWRWRVIYEGLAAVVAGSGVAKPAAGTRLLGSLPFSDHNMLWSR